MCQLLSGLWSKEQLAVFSFSVLSLLKGNREVRGEVGSAGWLAGKSSSLAEMWSIFVGNESERKQRVGGREGFYRSEGNWINRWEGSSWNPVMNFYPYHWHVQLSFTEVHVTCILMGGWRGELLLGRRQELTWLGICKRSVIANYWGIMRVKIYMLIPKLITLGNCLLLSVEEMGVSWTSLYHSNSSFGVCVSCHRAVLQRAGFLEGCVEYILEGTEALAIIPLEFCFLFSTFLPFLLCLIFWWKEQWSSEWVGQCQWVVGWKVSDPKPAAWTGQCGCLLVGWLGMHKKGLQTAVEEKRERHDKTHGKGCQVWGERGCWLLLNRATEDDKKGRCASFGFTHDILSHGWKCEVGKAELSVHK